jgi:hypothetical protein
LVGDPGVLDGFGRVGVAELSLKRRDISGFISMVSAHGIPGVMGRAPPLIRVLNKIQRGVLADLHLPEADKKFL